MGTEHPQYVSECTLEVGKGLPFEVGLIRTLRAAYLQFMAPYKALWDLRMGPDSQGGHASSNCCTSLKSSRLQFGSSPESSAAALCAGGGCGQEPLLPASAGSPAAAVSEKNSHYHSTYLGSISAPLLQCTAWGVALGDSTEASSTSSKFSNAYVDRSQ